MNMKTLLDVEIEEKTVALANLDPGSKEYNTAVDSITKLMDRRIELEKLETSEAQAEQQMREDRKSRFVKNLIDVGAIVLPLAVTVWGAKVSFKFEENGTITTAVGRKFMDKLISKK